MTEQEIINEFKEYLNDLSKSNSIKDKYSNKKGVFKALDFTKHFSEKLKIFSTKIEGKSNELLKKANKDVDKGNLKTELNKISKKMINDFKIKNQ